MRRPLFLGLALACAPPAPPPEVAPRLLEDLEALRARAERLAVTGPLLLAAGEGCAIACDLYGTRRIEVSPAGAACECNETPNLGLHPIRRRATVAQAAGPETLARPVGRAGGAP